MSLIISRFSKFEAQCKLIPYISVTLPLELGKDYNLNVVKVIEVTDQFLTLDEAARGCQIKESEAECFTRNYVGSLLEQCNCLPFSMRLHQKVLS